MSNDILESISSLKKEHNSLLLSHNYQESRIQETADFTGDSLELSQIAKKTEKELLVFAGATFMAETAAILNPEKTVLIPSTRALCPMAHMLSPEKINHYRSRFPKATFALYVNSTAETKAMADICITSGNAVKVISQIDNTQVLIGPDRNLALYIQKKIPDKEIIPFPEVGNCYVHRKFTHLDIEVLKSKHPDAKILAHPECDPSVQVLADKICSTSGMLNEAKTSNSKKFIIATEIGLIDRLRSDLPNKTFIPARKDAICIQQKKITIYNLFLSYINRQFQIRVTSKIAKKARSAIIRMLELSE
ncbi:MAG: quinolinate synthase NadA [Candidatus Hodarchaeales archaeon]